MGKSTELGKSIGDPNGIRFCDIVYMIYSRLKPELVLAKAAYDYALLHRKKSTHLISWMNSVMQMKQVHGRTDSDSGQFPNIFFEEKFFSQVGEKEYEALSQSEYLGGDGRELKKTKLEELSARLR